MRTGEGSVKTTVPPYITVGTRVIILAEDVPEGIRKEDHDAGLRSSLENLARYLASH